MIDTRFHRAVISWPFPQYFRNGVSTICTRLRSDDLSDWLVLGFPKSVRVQHVKQEVEGTDETVLSRVMKGDLELTLLQDQVAAAAAVPTVAAVRYAASVGVSA